MNIVYDAQNAYGALIRETQICVYPVLGTDVRTDLESSNTGGDLGDALSGKGYYAPNAKLPTRGERELQLTREVDAMLNRERREDAPLNANDSDSIEAAADRLEAMADNTL